MRPLLLIMLSMTLGSAEAGFYGRLESRVQADNRYVDSLGFIEEYADIRFVNEQQGFDSGISLALRQADENEANLYRLFFEKKLDGFISSYKLGRLQRSDNLGFYTLDGGLIKARNESFLLTLYAGKPSRADDYNSVDGDALYGFDFHFTDVNLPQLSSSISINKAATRIGMQRLQADSDETDLHETRINWGLSTSGDIQNSLFKNFGLDFNGSYLSSENSTEQLQLKLYGDLDKNNHAQIDYETFSLKDPALSFREQFYSVYAVGRQTSFTGSYFFNQNAQTKWNGKGRTVIREFGGNGYGLTLGTEYREYSGTEYLAQLDYLTVDEDSIISLYAETNYSFSALIKSTISAAVQAQNKWLTGNNQAVGIEADFQQILRSGLYFSFSVSSVWNSHLDDEYLFGLKLSYRFDESKKWWSND